MDIAEIKNRYSDEEIQNQVWMLRSQANILREEGDLDTALRLDLRSDMFEEALS